jgi:hypothetical protein
MPLVALADFYGLTKIDVPTRKMVISEPLETIADRNQIKNIYIFYIYKIMRWIFTSLYFYFFPFYITLISFTNIVFEKSLAY